MQKHLEEVLTTAGLTPEQVKALVDLPEDTKDFKAETHITPISTATETRIKNDPKFYEGLNKENLPKEFVKQLEQEQYGRAATIVRSNMLKAVGLTDKDFEALGDDGKKIDVFSTAFAKKLSEGKVTDKELQQKLIEATTEIETLKAGQPELETKLKTKYEQQLSEEKTGFVVLAHLATVPGLKVSASLISEKVTSKLRENYAIVVNGTEAALRQKEKPDLKVLVGGKELTFEAAVMDVLKSFNAVEPDKKTQTKTGTVTVDVTPGDGTFKLNSHVNDKIGKRLKEEEGEAKK
jgi:hypothetical protein